MNRRLVSGALVAALLLAACGSSDSSSGSASTDAPSTDAPATEVTVDDPTGSSPTDDSGDTVAGTADTASQDTMTDAADAFPVTIEHKFGSTTIDAEPTRVVSVGFNEHDFLLALGVVPVGLRDWYGEQPNSVWPWAQDELGDATPEVIAADALNFEQIAALEPDLIVGVWSGMTDQDYELLAAIAPTVAQSDTYDDFGTPWQEQTEILGRAIGQSDRADEVVADLEGRFEAARDAHPEWDGQTASVAFVTEQGPGAYTSQDTRSRIMVDLGFEIPDVNDSGGDGSFYLELSPEDITPLDVDALVWVAGSQEAIDGILEQLPTRSALDAVAEGREVFADIELSGAFSHGSPLSLEYVLNRLVPELEAAVDGDPTTVVPSAAVVGAVPAESNGGAADAVDDAGESADEAAAAWAVVFDSTVAFDDKSAHLADADSLSGAAEAYAAAGETMGGISLLPTDVEVKGDSAEIVYDVNFGENPAYTDQTGSIDLVDGTWIVSQDEFCAFMSSARVPCP
ncbi:iron-siderophore ABC transporter substrate-binding protein [Ilumatobacter sp.]|uniref:iron-siderophore ABC transporter substrate-binding protein n=1 Tax=Ilumatobacter sp. TaxID=1967498 RepID=UPI003C3BEDE8